MKKYFENRIEAIDWIANNTEDEGQFEVLREQLNFNFIYHGTYFVIKDKSRHEIVMLIKKEVK